MRLFRSTAVALFCLIPVLLPAEAPKQSYPPAAEVKAAFLKLLDRPKVALDVQVHESKASDDGLITERISIATEQNPGGDFERVPILLVRPENANRELPAVIVLHGTGGNKESQRP